MGGVELTSDAEAGSGAVMNGFGGGGDLAAQSAPARTSKTRLGLIVGAVVGVSVAFGLVASVGSNGQVETEGASAPSVGVATASGEQLGFAEFDSADRIVMEDYDTSRVFSSFLPGVGGEFGVPMWGFYVNRGQGLVTFGSENKDKPLMEFQTANKAYEVATKTAFRTFVKGPFGVYEPFSPAAGDFTGEAAHAPKRSMVIGMNEFEVIEVNEQLGLQTNVLYYTIPGEDFGGLVRKTTFTNLGSKKLDLEVLDGPAVFEPFGVDDWHLKNMGRTLEAWIRVENMDTTDDTLPFAKLSASLADTAIASSIISGNTAVSFVESPDNVDAEGNYILNSFVVDPDVVFGKDTSLDIPQELTIKSVGDMVAGVQQKGSKTPCMLAAAPELSLAAGKSTTVTSIYGTAFDLDTHMSEIVPKLISEGFVAEKRAEAIKLTRRLTDKVGTKSGSKVFDEYTRMMMLDNLLRGGYPELLGTDAADPTIFHTFSRIHGDMERDYNYFQIDASYFSQGPGAFRDVNQNRRVDTYQTPQVKDFNLRQFLAFLQSDGYNPLTVNSVEYQVMPGDDSNSTTSALLEGVVDEEHLSTLSNLLTKPFRPGDVFQALKVHGITLKIDRLDFLNRILAASEMMYSASFNQNGYWADHWTYTLDLAESALAIFPDLKTEMLYDSEPLPYFLSPAVMLPKSKRYVYASGLGPRQYNFIYTNPDRVAAIAANTPRTLIGVPAPCAYQTNPEGEVYRSSTLVKLLVLAITKFSLLDPHGMALEMEGGKPGWNDAMNGLCALFGSGMPEMYELIRLLDFLYTALMENAGREVVMPGELAELLHTEVSLVEEYKSHQDDFKLWDSLSTARDDYRNATSLYIGATETTLNSAQLAQMIKLLNDKLEAGVAKAVAFNGGLSPTYFIYNVTSFDTSDEVDGTGRPYVTVNGFNPVSVPLFLEGPVRQMKTLKTVEERREVYSKIKATDLYDAELAQYKISGSLAGMSLEIGRMVAFTPGWLENESIWLHMSYKYYLELLRGGLFDLFFEEIKTGLVAFMDPQTYGRSPLECSSFIASSASPDKSIHGQGYLARLSGSTAEYLSMWNYMMQGPAPFKLDNAGALTLALEPALAAYLFDEHGELTFTFLGQVPVTYHNPNLANTWEVEGGIQRISLNYASGDMVAIEGSVVPSPYAEQVRQFAFSSVDVHFA